MKNNDFWHDMCELSVSKEEIDQIHKKWDADPEKMERDLAFATEHVCNVIKRTFDREVDVVQETIKTAEYF